MQTENQPRIKQSPQSSSISPSGTRQSLMALIEHWKKKAFGYLELARKEQDAVSGKSYESSALSIAYCIQDLEKNPAIRQLTQSASLQAVSVPKAQTSIVEAQARRLEGLGLRASYEPQCPACKDKKLIPGDPHHPERGLKRCEACKPSPTQETCLICEQANAVRHHSGDCLAKLKAENAQLGLACSVLRRAAFDYLEAETKYQEAHRKNRTDFAALLQIARTFEDLQNIGQIEPVDMILPCPKCGKLHIDAPEPENGWTNPPHKSHLCHGCGIIFRPADVPTNGVAAIKTRGENDSPNNLINTQTNGSASV